ICKSNTLSNITLPTKAEFLQILQPSTMHKGVDVICADGSTVYAPFSGELSGPVKFFHNGNAIDDGVQIRGSGIQLFSFTLFNSSF
uniref:Uncharacterized protein n=1 Tax=Pavo cristatus TaxID=9049 RepID=A0A8C9FNV6_PAVCR